MLFDSHEYHNMYCKVFTLLILTAVIVSTAVQ